MNWVQIAQAGTETEAHIWRSSLEAAGIPAHVMSKSNAVFGALATGSLDSATFFEVWVPLEYAHQALGMLDTSL
jgi:hypothetical protein